MTSVISPVPSLGLGLSTGLNGLAALGDRQAAAAARLDANSALVDQRAALAANGPRARIDQEIGGYQRLTSIVSQATSLTVEASSALNDIRGFLGEAEDFIGIVDSTVRSVLELQRADVDFQRILEDIETRATQARFDETAILTRTSAISADGFAPPLTADILNVSARNFDNRPTSLGGDGAFDIELRATFQGLGAGYEVTADALIGGTVVASYRAEIAAADVAETATDAALDVGKTVVLDLVSADAGLSELTRTRSQIVVSFDDSALGVAFPATPPAPAPGPIGAFSADFTIDEDAGGGALRVEGRAAPVVDGASDFLVQVQGSILKALGLTNASLRDEGRLQSATEAVDQALDYVDLAIVDVESANRILNTQADAIAASIEGLELGEEAFADIDEAGEFTTFVSGILQGAFAERTTSIAALNSRDVVGLAEASRVALDVDLLDGIIPFEFPDFLNDEATLSLVAQLSVPREDYVQAIRAGETLSNLGVSLPADVIADGAPQIVDQRRAIADLAESIEAIGRPNVPNFINLLD